MMTATQQIYSQSGTFVNVRSQFIAGTVTGGSPNVCFNAPGGVLTSTVSTGGAGGYTYQWQDSLPSGVWNNIVGQTTLSYTIGSMIATKSFRIKYTDGTCGLLYSNITTEIVYPNLVASIVSGGNTPSCFNTNTGTLTATAPTGGSGIYNNQWQDSTAGVWSDIVGQTALTLVTGVNTITMGYRLKTTDPACSFIYSNVKILVVYPQLNAGSEGTSQTICYNTAPALLVNLISPTGGDGTYTYQWESSPNGFAPWAPIIGATNPSYQPPIMITPTYFHRVVTTGSGCGFGTSLSQ